MHLDLTLVAEEDILAKLDFRLSTQARDDKSSLWRAHVAFHKHPAESHIKQALSAIWLQSWRDCSMILGYVKLSSFEISDFSSKLQLCMLHSYTWVLESLPLHSTTRGVPTQDTFNLCTQHTGERFPPQVIPNLPNISTFCYYSQILPSEVLLCTGFRLCALTGGSCGHLWKHTQRVRSTFQAK